MSPKVGMEPIRRKQVIKATLAIVADQGLEKITLDEVAKRAGISKGVINYYFDSKYNLLLEAFKGFLDSYNEIIMAAYNPQMQPMEIFEIIIDSIFLPEKVHERYIKNTKKSEIDSVISDLSYVDVSKLMMIFYPRAALDENYRDTLKNMYVEYKKGMQEVLDYGIAEKQFSVDNSESFLLGHMAMIDGFAIYLMLDFPGLDREKAAEICKDYLRKYLL
jgi:AcrR family transcriptional regulator